MSNKTQVFYIAHCYFGEELTPLREEEELAYIFYMGEKNRQKPGFLRRKGERISVIARLYYPLIIRKFRNGYSLIFDPYRNEKHRVSYYILDRGKIDEIISDLEKTSEKEFLDKLVYLENIVKNIVSLKEAVMSREAEIGPVILDQELIEELKTIINRNTEYEFPGIGLPYNEINTDEYVKNINRVIDEIAEVIAYTTSLRTRLKKVIDEKISIIEEKYNAVIEELEKKLESLKEEVNLKVNELLNKKNTEVEETKKHYNEIINEIETRIKSLENTLEKLKEEEEKAREYGGRVDEIKKRKSETQKELKRLKEQLEDYKEKMESDLREIEARYRELIENERSRIKNLEAEKNKVVDELNNIKNQVSRRFEFISNNLLKYIDKLKATEKKIMNASLPLPEKGEGIYYITLYLVMYVSEDTSRKTLYTPVKIIPPGRLRSARVQVFDNIERYMAIVEDSLSNLVIRQRIEENNLLKKAPLERIQVGLSMLADKGFVEYKDIDKIIDSLRKQIEVS